MKNKYVSNLEELLKKKDSNIYDYKEKIKVMKEIISKYEKSQLVNSSSI